MRFGAAGTCRRPRPHLPSSCELDANGAAAGRVGQHADHGEDLRAEWAETLELDVPVADTAGQSSVALKAASIPSSSGAVWPPPSSRTRAATPRERQTTRQTTCRVAEGVGFEPTSESPRWRFSRPLPSTSRPPSAGLNEDSTGCGGAQSGGPALRVTRTAPARRRRPGGRQPPRPSKMSPRKLDGFFFCATCGCHSASPRDGRRRTRALRPGRHARDARRGGAHCRGHCPAEGRIAGRALDDLVELAAVEPHAAARGAVVDLDALALGHRQVDVAHGALHRSPRGIAGRSFVGRVVPRTTVIHTPAVRGPAAR